MPSSKVGRPIKWPTQIQAPTLALELYALIAKLQNSDAFDSCHIWSGSLNGSTPVIKWHKKNQSVTQIINGYLGLPHGQRTCDTPNCVNPFHHVPYAAPEAQFLPPKRVPNTLASQVNSSTLGDYVELVELAIDSNGIIKDNISFTVLRPLIPTTDITDAYLHDAIAEYKRLN